MDNRKRNREDSREDFDRDNRRQRGRDQDYEYDYDRDRDRDRSPDRNRDRDRGRDRSRSYDRYQDRNRYRDRDRDRDWDRDRDSYRDRGRDDGYDRRSGGRRDYYDDDGRGRGRGRYDSPREPTKIVMLRGLEPNCSERSVLDAVNAEQQFDVNSLRIIRDKHSGACKGFAFLEFFAVDEACSFMKKFAASAIHPLDESGGTGKELLVSDRPLTIDFASELGEGGDRRRARAEDWVCSNCRKLNFARRQECFSCGQPMGPDTQLASEFKRPAARREMECKVLHVFNLPQNCTEDMVQKTFSEFGSVQTVRLTPTGGRAYVEYMTVDEAQQAYRICVSQQNILRVGNAIVHVEMANLATGGSSSSSGGYAHSVATTALQSAGWFSQGDYTSQQLSSQVVNTQRAPQKLLEWPTPFDQGGATYRIEPTSGLYYEDKSGYYYNYTTKTYYSTVTQKYFKHKDNKFEECEGPKPEEGEITETNEAKSGEGSKSSAKSSTPTQSGAVSFALDSINLELGKVGNEKSSSGETEGSSSSQSKKGIKATKLVPLPKEAKKIDSNLKQWSKVNQFKPICRLCRRKFKSEAKLEKHVKLSALHKKNLELQKGKAPDELGKPISTAAPKSVAAATKAASAAGYRDRAGDRRKLFGQGKGAEDSREREVDKAEHPIYVTEEENAGTKLLKAMGWKEGQGLGKDGNGMVAPLRVDGTTDEPDAIEQVKP